MKHPPYPLRTNKAIDRYLLIEAIKLIGTIEHLREYRYIGFGGPYLEDLKLIHEHFPKIRFVSIEQDEETYKRQKFHQPCSGIELIHQDFSSYLAQTDFEGEKKIVWLDYVGLELTHFNEFAEVLQKVDTGSLVKLTVQAQPTYHRKAEDFQRKFLDVLPSPTTKPPEQLAPFAFLLQQMVQISAQRALVASGQVYQPIYSSCYADGVGMFSICGMVVNRDALAATKDQFRPHRISNLEWGAPKLLEIPFLSTKERLKIQEHLPCTGNSGEVLTTSLGYAITGDKTSSERQLKEYADFYGYYPHLVKAIP